jgi:hypothetical protein
LCLRFGLVHFILENHFCAESLLLHCHNSVSKGYIFFVFHCMEVKTLNTFFSFQSAQIRSEALNLSRRCLFKSRLQHLYNTDMLIAWNLAVYIINDLFD